MSGTLEGFAGVKGAEAPVQSGRPRYAQGGQISLASCRARGEVIRFPRAAWGNPQPSGLNILKIQK